MLDKATVLTTIFTITDDVRSSKAMKYFDCKLHTVVGRLQAWGDFESPVSCRNRPTPPCSAKKSKPGKRLGIKSQTGVNWQYTTKDARTKLKHLYPLIEQ